MFFIAGSCVMESECQCLQIAEKLFNASKSCGVEIVYKASYDKANRRDMKAYRGLGIDEGLRILGNIKRDYGLRVLADVHSITEAKVVGESDSVDVVQIPALLCRQTDLIVEAAKSGKIVNIKKGPSVNPADMISAVNKVGDRGKVWITERGSFFGYDRMVVDFVGIQVMQEFHVPVIVDVSHSVPDRSYSLGLARAAIGAGVDGLYFEVSEEPEKALCDGKTSMILDNFCSATIELCEMEK